VHQLVNKNFESFAVLGYYAAFTGTYRRFGTTCRSYLGRSNSWTAGSLKMGSICCPETSITIIQCCLTPKKREDLNSLFHISCTKCAANNPASGSRTKL
jgi:hypothetical protein